MQITNKKLCTKNIMHPEKLHKMSSQSCFATNMHISSTSSKLSNTNLILASCMTCKGNESIEK